MAQETGSDGSDDESEAGPVLTWKEKAVKLATGTAPGQKATSNSPTARLKLLLVSLQFHPLRRIDY